MCSKPPPMALLTFSSLHFTVVVDMLWVVAPWMSKRCILDTHSVAPLWKNVLKTFPPMALLSFLTLHLTVVVDMLWVVAPWMSKRCIFRHSLGCPPVEKCAENLPPNGTALFLNSASHRCGGHDWFLHNPASEHGARLFGDGVCLAGGRLVTFFAGIAQTRSCGTPFQQWCFWPAMVAADCLPCWLSAN